VALIYAIQEHEKRRATTPVKKRPASEAPSSGALSKRIKAAGGPISSESPHLLPLARATETSLKQYQPSTSSSSEYVDFTYFYRVALCNCRWCDDVRWHALLCHGYEYLFVQWKCSNFPEMTMFRCWEWNYANEHVPDTP